MLVRGPPRRWRRVDQDLAQEHAVASCSSTALASCSSVIRPWLTRKWPRYSSGSVEAGGDDQPVLEEDLLLDLAVVDLQRAGLRALGEPLEQLLELHRPEVADDAHECAASYRRAMRSRTRCAERRSPAAAYLAGRRRPALALVVAGGAGLAVGDVGLGLHGDEDELGDAPAGFEDEGLRAEVLQLEGDVALEAGVAPAGQGVVDPQPAEGGLELQVAGDVARDAHVLDGRGEHHLAGEELDVRRA